MRDDQLETLARSKAAEMWQTFTPDEKTMVRFGMFPACKMFDAEQALGGNRDASRELAVALMNCATKDGGMRA